MKSTLRISGKVFYRNHVPEKYFFDASPYTAKPVMAAVPKTKQDVVKIVKFAEENRMKVIARGAGTNTSGSAIGNGIIIDFSGMNKILWIKGNRARVQPGVIYDQLDRAAGKRGYFVPFNPGSRSNSTIGGNIATKAAGMSSVKYGSADALLKAAEFVDSGGRITNTKKLPPELKNKIADLGKQILRDKKALKVLKSKKGLKTSSGYNLFAFLQHNNTGSIAAHLMSGSVGTLGLLTEIELELPRRPEKKIACIAYFSDLAHAGKFVLEALRLEPSVLEVMDVFALDVLRKMKVQGIPANASASLLIQFDEKIVTSSRKLGKLLEKSKATAWSWEKNMGKQEKILSAREHMFHAAGKAIPGLKALSFVEDMGVPVKHLAAFIKDIEAIFSRKKIPVVIYGHAGEGNIHVRPLIDVRKKAWRKLVEKIALQCFECTRKYNGTIAGEHGIGRNKAFFLEKEWGKQVYGHFMEVKKAFDPQDILNAGTMFSKAKITKQMKY